MSARITSVMALMALVHANAQQVQTKAGSLEGTVSSDSKIRIYKGIPFAAPPVGDLRWKPPQAGASWEGVRKATEFGARCMQAPLFPDMVFRDNGPSEDCLYLNVWTPATSGTERLPVMFWIYGGGFQAGAASEPRQDGETLAHKGVVVVSFNYRLGIFGFFSHPELTKESPHHASGNYGLLDQAAALQWVHDNIASFGGDPAKVTIFGESAGSISVSEQMASPLSKNLIAGAIGESGGVFMMNDSPQPVTATEKTGEEFASMAGTKSLADLRAMPAQGLLDTVMKHKMDFRFWPNVDGYFFPEDPAKIYASGQQAHVPLLAGWNADEQGYQGFLGKDTQPTPEAYAAKVNEVYKQNANKILKLYPGKTEPEVKESARDLASDRFIAYSTWKWLDMQVKTGSAPVYRYHFEQAPPQPAGEPSNGAYHSADIEYVFEALPSKQLPWTDADRKLSDVVSTYWSNFAKTGDPNGGELPKWPTYNRPKYEVMHLQEGASGPVAAPDKLRARYQALDQIGAQHDAK